MKQKLLKINFIIDGVIILIFCVHRFSALLSSALQYLAIVTDSSYLHIFQGRFQNILELGLDDELAAILSLYFFFVIIILSVFSTIFYFKTSISPVTHVFLILSPLTYLIQYIATPIFFPYSSGHTSYIIYAVLLFICIIAITVYAVLLIRFMCRDFKNLSIKPKNT